MKKYIFLIAAIFFSINKANAALPQYTDDIEFEQCTRTTSIWDPCVKEETSRFLDKIKQQYRDILYTSDIQEWKGDLKTDTETMRDMYESWIAYRNRLCSLSNAAARNLEPIVTEKYSCTLYHTLHHHNHMGQILQLLRGKRAPQGLPNQPQKPVTLFRIAEHDAEFTKCLSNKKPPKECWDAENDRATKRIKDLYKTLSKDEHVGQWNNGPDLQSGNYRDMFDSWIAYRNRICSLAAFAYQKSDAKHKISLNGCVLFLNKEHVEILESLLVMANSALDDGFEEVYDGEGNMTDNPVAENDGGLAEGKTITPLERRLDESDQPLNIELTDRKKTAPTQETQAKEVDNQPSLPAWAKQN